MTKLYVNPDYLAEAYSDIASFQDYHEQIVEYQRNIKSAFLTSIDNEELRQSFTKCENLLNGISAKAEVLKECLSEIYSITDWCNENVQNEIDSIAVAAQVGTAVTVASTTSNNLNTYISNMPQTSDTGKALASIALATLPSISALVEKYGNNAKATFKVAKDAFSVVSKSIKFAKDNSEWIGVKVKTDGTYAHLKNYSKGSGLAARYKLDNYAAKRPKISSSLNTFDKVMIVAKCGINLVKAGKGIYDTWTDDSKTTEEKIYDTTAYGICAAASVALTVGGTVAGKAITTAVSVMIPVPIVGTAVGLVAGTVVSGLMDAAAEVMLSEKVVNQVSDSVEKTVGVAKAGADAVSNATEKLKNSESVGDAVKNTANLVGTAVVAGAQVVATAVTETVKVVGTVVTETLKSVGNTLSTAGKTVANVAKKIFKGW